MLGAWFEALRYGEASPQAEGWQPKGFEISLGDQVLSLQGLFLKRLGALRKKK